MPDTRLERHRQDREDVELSIPHLETAANSELLALREEELEEARGMLRNNLLEATEALRAAFKSLATTLSLRTEAEAAVSIFAHGGSRPTCCDSPDRGGWKAWPDQRRSRRSIEASRGRHRW